MDKNMKAVSLKGAKAAILKAAKKNLSVYIQGDPGVGKSQMVHEIGGELNRPITDIRAILYDMGDLMMKVPNQDRTALVEIVTDVLPRVPNHIVFLDEFRQAPVEVRRMFYQLILDRKLGSTYVLPEGTMIIAASNKSDDVNTEELEGPLFDRWVVRLTVNTDKKDFLDYIFGKENSHYVAGYISTFPEDFIARDKESGAVITTPRRWEMVVNNPELSEEILPPGTGVRFTEFVKKVDMFKDTDNYVDGSKGWPEDVGDQYAVMTAVIAAADKKDYEKKVMDVLEMKMKGCDEEIRALLVFSMLRLYKRRKNAKNILDLLMKSKHEDKIIGVLNKYRFMVDDA
jgi:hypothetical protein